MKIYRQFRRSRIFRIFWGFSFLPLSILYAVVIILIRKFRSKNKYRPQGKVLSIGNITVGGTGKTPLTIYLSQLLTSLEIEHSIFTTGYKRHGSESQPIKGDESLDLADRLPGVKIVASPHRVEQLISSDKAGNLKLAILDDGFQQWGIEKDLDIVLIDSTLPFGNFLTLPGGILREPLSGIKRADLVILTHFDEINETDKNNLEFRLRKMGISRDKIFKATHSITGFENGDNLIEPSQFKGDKIILVSGIGNPDSFFLNISQLGLEIERHFIFPDHYNYSIKDLNRISNFATQAGIKKIITTSKDLIKLKSLISEDFPALYSARLEFNLFNQVRFENLIEEII